MKRLSIVIIFSLMGQLCLAQPGLSIHDLLVVTDALRLRKDEAVTSPIVATMAKGTAVKVLAIGKADAIDGLASSWVKIEVQGNGKDRNGQSLPAGTRGWCFGGYLSPRADFAYTLLKIEREPEPDTIGEYIVADIEPNCDESELRSRKGDSASIEEVREEGINDVPLRYSYGNFQAYVRFGKAEILYFFGRDIKTKRGVGIGDTAETVKEKYPTAYYDVYHGYSSGTDERRYIYSSAVKVESEKAERVYFMSFTLDDTDRVSRISVSQYWNDGRS